MNIEKFLEKAKRFELEAYKRLPDLTLNHVAFSGAPQKHPYDEKKIILIADPFSTHTFYYRFDMADIGGVEVLPSLVTAEGESVTMARVWVKKGSIGLKFFPFVVADTSQGQIKPAPVD